MLVIIAAPLMGHMRQTVEMAKLILHKTNKISIQVLLMEIPTDPEGTEQLKSIAAASSTEDLIFHHLPKPQDTSHWPPASQENFLYQLIDFAKTHVRESIKKIKNLCGLIIDPIYTTMIDIADEFGVPSYLFFTCGAGFLAIMLHFQALHDEQNIEFPDDLLRNGNEIITPCFSIPVLADVIPGIKKDKQLWTLRYLQFARDYRRTKAIMVNTFQELEDFVFKSFTSDLSYGNSRLPPVHPIGPILSRVPNSSSKDHSEMMKWLDAQPPLSVVFLCFGSMRSFPADQTREIAKAIEHCGYRFLLSFRQPPASKEGFPSEYENQEDVLPEGFLNRTKSIGKVVGWVQQLDVLSHSAVGGFVSHCGWNSILESIWCGVPIATFPLGGDQNLNAFQLVKELGIAQEIVLDYDVSRENQRLVTAEEIQSGIERLMDDCQAREKVKVLSEKSKEAMGEGGSSYLFFEDLIKDMTNGPISQ